MKRACIASWGFAAALIFGAVPVQAQAVHLIESFEGYTESPGDWVISSNNSINVSLGLNLDSAIVGVKDLKVDLGVGGLGSNYTISNSNLDVPLPSSAEQFTFTIKPLVALNLDRNVVVTLLDQNDISHVSQVKALGLLSLGTATDLNFDLSSFTPPVDGDVTAINGVDLKFTSSVLSIAAEEQIDEIRLLSDNSSVSEWMCY